MTLIEYRNSFKGVIFEYSMGYSNIKENYRNGFTIVEMLISIAIVGIVLSLAIPQFKKTREENIKREKESATYTLRKITSVENGEFLVRSSNYSTSNFKYTLLEFYDNKRLVVPYQSHDFRVGDHNGIHYAADKDGIVDFQDIVQASSVKNPSSGRLELEAVQNGSVRADGIVSSLDKLAEKF